MIKMLQFILSIPECVGWILVGFFASACADLLFHIILGVIEMVRNYREEKMEMENEMENGD